jgi:LysM repeat protein
MPSDPSKPRVKLRAATRRVPRTRASVAEDSEAEPEPNMKLSRAIVVMLLLHVVAIGGVFAFSLIKEHNPSRRASDDASPQATEAEDLRLPAAPSTRVAAVETARSRAEAPGGVTRPGVHVVRPGETLTRIANDNGVPLEALVAANGANTVTSGLRPGQELKLPTKFPAPPPRLSGPMADALQIVERKPVSSSMPPSAAASSVGKKPLPLPDSGKTYVVGKGETPSVIAKKLNVSYDALLKLNQIDDPKKLKPGQKLRVPTAKAKG